MYYLRSQPAIQAQQFSIPLETLVHLKDGTYNVSTLEINSSTQFKSGMPLDFEPECLVCGT
jgi:hypothetical protein